MISNEQVSTFVKTHPLSVGSGILAVALAIAIYFRGDNIPQAEKALDEKSTLGQRIDANIKNGVQLPEQLNSVIASRTEIESRLVHPDELAKNQQFFYKLEADSAVKLVDIRQNPMPTKSAAKLKTSYIPVGYSVVVRGSYVHLLDFMRRLENGQRFCRVSTATINLGGASDADRKTELTISLSLELLGQP
ncbi:MAG: hypothetical protein JWM35_1377 [Verrucomicrobia bacterium]|nr:hypothetical protein [Verrucomicrobiota bacterium]